MPTLLTTTIDNAIIEAAYKYLLLQIIISKSFNLYVDGGYTRLIPFILENQGSRNTSNTSVQQSLGSVINLQCTHLKTWAGSLIKKCASGIIIRESEYGK